MEMDIIFHDPAHLPKRAFELAEQFQRPNTYDAHYLALAEHLDCSFWTADKSLFYATHESHQHINWIAS